MAGVPVYWDICDRAGVKNQDCYVSAGLVGWLGSFSPPSWICHEQALGNAFSQMYGAGPGTSRVSKNLHCFK